MDNDNDKTNSQHLHILYNGMLIMYTTLTIQTDYIWNSDAISMTCCWLYRGQIPHSYSHKENFSLV